MASYLLAGGGTAGHVNPMLAIADEIKRREPEAHILMVGTKEGLEARLVPERGYELHTIPRLPFPRRPNVRAVRFVLKWRKTVEDLVRVIGDRHIDVVIGVGGYVAAPAYSAAKKVGVPIVIHEANAKPGMANLRAARWTPYVGVAFRGTRLPHARFVGMPLRSEIETLDIKAERMRARKVFGFAADAPVLVVTGGSLGATQLNRAIVDAAGELTAQGINILHITGAGNAIRTPDIAGYQAMDYCSDMGAAFSAATLVVSRAGSSTVSELSALGVPTVYVPYAVGNGEQMLNARESVEAGGAILVPDADFTTEWVLANIPALIRDDDRLTTMAAAAASVGELHGSSLTVDLVGEALTASSGS